MDRELSYLKEHGAIATMRCSQLMAGEMMLKMLDDSRVSEVYLMMLPDAFLKVTDEASMPRLAGVPISAREALYQNLPLLEVKQPRCPDDELISIVCQW